MTDTGLAERIGAHNGWHPVTKGSVIMTAIGRGIAAGARTIISGITTGIATIVITTATSPR